jgi:hypothetical protein
MVLVVDPTLWVAERVPRTLARGMTCTCALPVYEGRSTIPNSNPDRHACVAHGRLQALSGRMQHKEGAC